MTLRRYPNGVDAKSFFEKRCPSHRPDWVEVAHGPGDRGGPIGYCLLDDRAALVWAANLAAIELHAPMARADDIESPEADGRVHDLDPGAPARPWPECADVGHLGPRRAGRHLGPLELVGQDVGLEGAAALRAAQLRPGVHTHEHASEFALAVAQVIEEAPPRQDWW